MAGHFEADDDQPFASINVVPLVDIILVVLIIFMVTAPMIIRPSLNVNLPKAAAGDESSETPLSVAIDAAGQIFLNGKPSDQTHIQAFAKEQLAKNSDLQAVIAADQATPHGKVVGLIDMVKSVGVKRFAISIDRK